MAPVADDEIVDTPGDDLRDVLGMPPRRAPAVLAPGQIIDDAYRIEEEIGAGGMGRVYRAHDLRLSRDVALKLHGFAIAPDDNTLRREATALARLTHPNVVTVYEVGTWNDHPWVAMAFVPGGTVRTWLQAKPRTAREILSLFIAAGRGLEAAHAAGLVHRDFKPDNVLVGDDGRICVADFGLARDAGNAESNVGDLVGSPASSPLASHTKTGAVRGTPAYMAPEQRDGTRVDASADQYAFAVSLWETLADQRPFGDDPSTIAPPPSGRMPRHVEVALRRALSTVPSHRWPSMSELLDELARDPIRTRFIVAASIVGVLVLVGGGFAIARRTQAAQPDPGVLACDTSAELASLWSDESRTKVLATYPGQVGTRIIASVDAWTEQWRKLRADACHTAAKDPALAERTNTCLDRARARLGSSLSVLETALQPVDAITVGTIMTSLANCADASVLPPRSTVPTASMDRARWNIVESLIAQSDTWQHTTKGARAIPIALSAVGQAQSLGFLALQARAQTSYASALYNAGNHDNMLEPYEGAVRLAAEAHDDVLVAEIYLKMLTIVIQLQKQGEIDRLISVAESAIERASRPQYLLDQLAAKRADVARLREDFVAAIPLYQQAVVAAEARHGESTELARSLTLLAQCYTRLHRTDEARAALQRAATIIQKLYGDIHPNLGTILTSLGDIDLQDGRYTDAITAYRRSLAIKESSMGPMHKSLGATLVNLANALTMHGDLPEAIKVGRRAVEIVEKTFPPGHPRVAIAINVLGDALRVSKDYAGAEAMFQRAIGMFPANSTDPLLSDPLRNLTMLYAETGKLRGARPIVVRALSIVVALDPTSVDTSRVRLVLARIDRDPKAYQAALEQLTTILGKNHPEVVSMRMEQARMFGPTTSKPR
jgi:serine/threonine protein kinase/tetratricopeptide (TPR) repeat protein